MNGTVLLVVSNERDLGIELRSDMKVSDQCSKSYIIARRVLIIIRYNIHFKAPDIPLRLYKSFVRPRVDYCTVAWSLYYKKYKELLEKVQHSLTKMTNSIRHMDHNERIKALGLWMLEERRNWADLIFLFKTCKGFSHPPFESLFRLSGHDRTRGHAVKLVEHCTRRDDFLLETSDQLIRMLLKPRMSTSSRGLQG